MTRVQFLAEAMMGFFPSCHHIQTGLPGLLSYVLGALTLGCEADHSLPCSAEVKNVWNCTSIPYIFIARCLVKHRIHLHGVV